MNFGIEYNSVQILCLPLRDLDNQLNFLVMLFSLE